MIWFGRGAGGAGAGDDGGDDSLLLLFVCLKYFSQPVNQQRELMLVCNSRNLIFEK